MPQQVLKKSLNQLIEDLNNLNETSFIYDSFTFNSNDLPTPGQEGNIWYHELYKDLFSYLEVNKKYPFIYWFEIKNDIDCIQIRTMVDEYAFKLREEISKGVHKDNRNFYSVPAITKHIKDINSKVLYVGKVKKNLRGRLVPHLGYHHKSLSMQGLQLARWANEVSLELEFHDIQLPIELEGLASLLEFELAGELKPILGKHRG